MRSRINKMINYSCDHCAIQMGRLADNKLVLRQTGDMDPPIVADLCNKCREKLLTVFFYGRLKASESKR